MVLFQCLLSLCALNSAAALITTNPHKLTTISSRRIPLRAITKDVVYDGPEWTSIQDSLGVKTSNSYGKMTVVAGEREDTGEKIVGVVADSNSGLALKGTALQVQESSVAKIPSAIQEQDAINTMIAALTGIQCTLPKVEGVGGANPTEENSMVSGKVVILGGSDYACFAAEGLAVLGTKVSLVSTNAVTVDHLNVDVLGPAVGDDEIGFARHVGDFDSLLDTANDERPSKTFNNEEEDGDVMSQGTTLRLLKQRHKCERYVSSMTKAQSIVSREGVFFGPGKVKNYVKEVSQKLNSKPATFQSIVPPPSFGRTVETLLDEGIIYTNTKDFLTANSNMVVRGWSLKDFMEISTWPVDSSGAGSGRVVRFGLPVMEDEEEWEDEEEDDMVSAPPQTADGQFIQRDAWDKSIAEDEQEREDADMKNPFVRKITGTEGMYDTIVREQRDAVLFLSATWCRTCKTLNPKFTSLARQSMDEDEDGILFAKADTTGNVGKELSRLLNVEAVPVFVLFRNGRRYGPALSISRIPSKKLSAALDRLQSGQDWDTEAIKEADEQQQ